MSRHSIDHSIEFFEFTLFDEMCEISFYSLILNNETYLLDVLR